MTPDIERLLQRIDATGDCWEWTGRLSADGYGVLDVANRPVPAHRFLYDSLVATLPAWLLLDHLCRNRSCVNPDHLDPVTIQEHNKRTPEALQRAKLAKARKVARKAQVSRTHCKRGHPLTPDNIYTNRLPSRICKTCHRLRSRRRYWRQKAARDA